MAQPEQSLPQKDRRDVSDKPTGIPALPQPCPLGDPLRSFRKFLPWLLALPFVLAVVGVVAAEGSLTPGQKTQGPGLLGVVLAVVLQLPLLGLVFHILPKRAVNAFYLRSFRNDRRSWPIRKAIQAALGRKFRLSGIRDPRRKMPVVLRFLAFTVFLFRYCTPKFMNLEAGPDWQARLWRSLADARCAFLDLSDLTPFVEEEIHLCYHALGPGRVLFIGDPSRSSAEWQGLVARVLALDDAARAGIQVAIWDDSGAGRKAFRDAIRSFASRLPRGVAGLNKEYPIAARSLVLPAETVRAEVRTYWVQMLLGLLLAGAVFWMYGAGVVPSTGWLALLWLIPLAMSAYVLFLTLGYLLDCGSLRERVVVTGWLVLFLGGYTGIVLVPLMVQVRKVQDLAYRAATKSNLRQIGLAMSAYHTTFGRLPGHAIYHEGKPVLSWRVALLPFLGEEALYRQFRLDEPWDSPHNQALLKSMPPVYAAAGEQGKKTSTTFYQVFVSRPGAGPRQQAVFELRPGPGRRGIEIGDRETILVVEAREAVPWTKPEDLPFGDAGPSAGPPRRLADLVGRKG